MPQLTEQVQWYKAQRSRNVGCWAQQSTQSHVTFTLYMRLNIIYTVIPEVFSFAGFKGKVKCKVM